MRLARRGVRGAAPRAALSVASSAALSVASSAASSAALFVALLAGSGAAWSAEAVLAGGASVAWMGRTADAEGGAVRFAYPGVSSFLRFEGRELVLVASTTGDKSYLDVIVDGAFVRSVPLSRGRASYRLVDPVSAGMHTVQVLHRSETWHGIVTVHGFATDGHVLAPPVLPSRRLLFLGDSVTCGEALERTPAGEKQSAWWNPRLSYGMLIGAALDAQVQLVCHGGRGLVRSWNGRTDEFNLPRFYELAIAAPDAPAPWNGTRDAPDLIVSAIGTNDFNEGIPDRAQYVDTYTAFLRTLLRDHPQATIVLTEGAILDGEKKAALSSYITDTIRRTGNPRVHHIPSRHYPGDPQDAHPTRDQHRRMANDFIPTLRQLMSW